MTSPERGFLERVREDRLKLQPPSHLRESILDRIKAEDKEKTRIEKLQLRASHHLEQSRLPLMLKEMGEIVGGTIHEGRDLFENRYELNVPKDEEVYPMVIPLSEESVVRALLWDEEYDPDPDSEVFISKAIVIEAFPRGDIFIYGNKLWGTSHSRLRERNADKDLQERMLEKAYQAPRIVYYNDNQKPQLIYVDVRYGEETQLF